MSTGTGVPRVRKELRVLERQGPSTQEIPVRFKIGFRLTPVVTPSVLKPPQRRCFQYQLFERYCFAFSAMYVRSAGPSSSISTTYWGASIIACNCGPSGMSTPIASRIVFANF